MQNSTSLVYATEKALAETRVQKPKCCFKVSETTIYIYIYNFKYQIFGNRSTLRQRAGL